MKFLHLIKILSRFFGIIFASLVLSGCLLLSDVDVVQKGVKTPLSDGDYLMSSFALSLTEKDSEKLDFSSFSTDLNEPDVQPISETAEGSFLSKSYSYELPNGKIKFRELNHLNLKDIYLAQISGDLGLEERSDKKMEKSARYSFMFAKFSEKGDLSLYGLAQEKKDILDYFDSKPVRLEIPEESKDMDFGIRKVVGDDDSVRVSIINFAETAMPNLLEPVIEFKKMCSGKISKWNNCVGKTDEPASGNYTEISIGPYQDGYKSGVFYRKRIFPDTKIMEIGGNFIGNKLDGPWLYKWESGARIIQFEKDVAKKIKYKRAGLYYEGLLFEAEPKMIGSLKEGFVQQVTTSGETITRVGKFSQIDKGIHGELIEGKFSRRDFSATGIRDENGNFISGSQYYGDSDSRYIGNFEKDKGLVVGAIIDDECEILGRFQNKNKRDGSTTTFLTEGKTICGNRITIGTTNPFCVEGNNLGGPIYFQNKNFSFWGLTNATCQKFNYGVMIENSTGKAFAVKAGENDFIKLKEVDLNTIMKEHSLN